MNPYQFQYYPLLVSPVFFLLFVGLIFLITLVQVQILRYAYTRIGIGQKYLFSLLLLSLLGADLPNLDKIGNLGVSVASIGGAGTFDGIFVTGILATLLAGIATHKRPERKLG